MALGIGRTHVTKQAQMAVKLNWAKILESFSKWILELKILASSFFVHKQTLLDYDIYIHNTQADPAK